MDEYTETPYDKVRNLAKRRAARWRSLCGLSLPAVVPNDKTQIDKYHLRDLRFRLPEDMLDYDPFEGGFTD